MAVDTGKSSTELARKAASFVMGAAIVIALTASYYLVYFLIRRPYYASSCIALGTLMWWYLSVADSSWHRSQNSENTFWMFLAGCFALSSMFTNDSPLFVHALFQSDTTADRVYAEILGGAVVLISTLVAHYIDKTHHRKMLDEKPRLRRGPSVAGLMQRRIAALGGSSSRLSKAMSSDNASAPGARLRGADSSSRGSSALSSSAGLDAEKLSIEEKLATVNQSLNELDFIYLPSNLHNYLNLQKILACERRIVRMFRHASKDDLNYLLLEVNLRKLLYKLRNHNTTTGIHEDGFGDWGGQSSNMNRNEFIDLIARQRVSDLTITARALFLDAIQVNRLTIPGTSSGTVAEAGAVNILMRTMGDQLSELKCVIDGKGSIQSTHKLVYEDIYNVELREKVLAHIQRQANVHAAHMAMGGSIARKLRQKSAWRKILSDVDDTLLSSGGRYPAGIDGTYPHHQLYPGVMRFYRELDLGTHESVRDGVWPEGRQGNMVFLSARPHVYKDMAEKRVYQKFEKMINANDLHCMPTLLPGDLDSGQAFMLRGDLQPMAEKKAKNFREYFFLYPEYKHIFVGDNGQADVKAGQYMVEQFGDCVQKIFVHEVQPRNKTFGYTPEHDALWHQMGVAFFKTYVGAAVIAFANNPPLISVQGLRRIVADAKTDFEKIAITSTRKRDDRIRELNRDMYHANNLLVANGQGPVETIRHESKFPLHSVVYTPFGRGFVRGFSRVTGIYAVELDIVQESYYHVPKARHGRNSLARTTTTALANDPPPQDAKAARQSPPAHGGVEQDGLSNNSAMVDGIADLYDTHKPVMGYFALAMLHGSEKKLEKAASKDTSPVSVSTRCYQKNPPKAPSKFLPSALQVGSHVHTVFGKGTILRYRGHDHMFHVKFGSFEAFMRESAFEERRTGLEIEDEESSGFNLFSLVRRLASPASQPTKVVPSSARFTVGNSVGTPFGKGTVAEHREGDDMYTLVLVWGARLYITGGCLASAVGDGMPPLVIDDQGDGVDGDQYRDEASSPFQKARKYVSGSRVMSFVSSPFTGRDETGSGDAEGDDADVVETAWGRGHVTNRRTDGIWEVKLAFGNAYVRPSVVQEIHPLRKSPSGGFLGSFFGGTPADASRKQLDDVPVGGGTPLEVGEAIETHYGYGVIVALDEARMVYEIELTWGGRVYFPEVSLLKDQQSLRDLKRDAHAANTSSISSSLLSLLSKFIPGGGRGGASEAAVENHQDGANNLLHGEAIVRRTVRTPFGQGRVSSYRVLDDMYEVELGYGVLFVAGVAELEMVGGAPNEEGKEKDERELYAREEHPTGGRARGVSSSSSVGGGGPKRTTGFLSFFGIGGSSKDVGADASDGVSRGPTHGVGEVVHTPSFGRGVVDSFDVKTGMYTIRYPFAKMYALESSIVATEGDPGVVAREEGPSDNSSSPIKRSGSLLSLPSLFGRGTEVCTVTVGSGVHTDLGNGVVSSFDSVSDMVTVELSYGVAYMRRGSVKVVAAPPEEKGEESPSKESSSGGGGIFAFFKRSSSLLSLSSLTKGGSPKLEEGDAEEDATRPETRAEMAPVEQETAEAGVESPCLATVPPPSHTTFSWNSVGTTRMIGHTGFSSGVE